MKKIYNLIVFLLFIATMIISGTGVSAAQTPEGDSPFQVYLPMVANPPPPAPPDYFSTSWYITIHSLDDMYDLGLEAGALTQAIGVQDQLLILSFGQPWSDGVQYGTIVKNEPEFNLTSTNDILYYSKQFITGFIAASDGISKLDLGIGTSNYAMYKDGVCTPLSWFCTEQRAYNHGKAWALMVKDLYNWVIQQGYSNRISVAGANDIELSWNYATITKAWIDGFDDYDSGIYTYYQYGTCDGCDVGINLSIPPDPDKDLVYDWTPRKAHYASWGAAPAWPIPEIYLNNGWNAYQWANLSKVGVDLGYSKMYFYSAMTQMQACEGSSDPICTYTDNTPNQAWYQLYNALNERPETSQYTIPYMTDIEWP